MALTKLAEHKADYSDEEFAPIVEHLASAVFWPSALMLFCRLTEFPVTEDLVFCLMTRAVDHSLAIVGLMQLAGHPLGGQFIMQHSALLRPAAERWPAQVLTLVLLLFQNPGHRRIFEYDPGFAPLLRALIVFGDSNVRNGVMKLFTLLRIEKEFAYAVGDCRLLPVIAVAAGSDETLLDAWLAIAGKIAVVFVHDLITCLPFVIGLLDRPPLLAGTLAFLVQIAEFPDAAAELKKAKVDKKIKGMKLQRDLAFLGKAVTSALK
jgi:hypothetical protein